MIKLRAVGRLCATVCCVAAPAMGQSLNADASRIEIVAAEFLRDSVGGKDVVFDSRVLSKGRPAAERPPSRVEAIARALNGRAAHEEEVVTCRNSRPDSCSVGATSFFHLSEPVVSGQSATVLVRHLYNVPTARTPTGRREFELRLEFSRSGWHVVSSTLRSTS
jgi:hypothetical protein